MKLAQQLLINRVCSSNEFHSSTGNEVRKKYIDQLSMKLEQHLLMKTGNEVRKTTIDQQGMKLGQQLLINREWS